jgi:hypothetical protein
MTRPLKFTVAQVIAALKETKGMVYLAADRLGCNAETVQNYAKRYKSVRDEIEAQREKVVDIAELKLYSAIMDGDQGMIKYYLSRRGKSRGYTTGQEISGPGGGPINVAIVKGYAQVSPDEWNETEDSADSDL